MPILPPLGAASLSQWTGYSTSIATSHDSAIPQLPPETEVLCKKQGGGEKCPCVLGKVAQHTITFSKACTSNSGWDDRSPQDTFCTLPKLHPAPPMQIYPPPISNFCSHYRSVAECPIPSLVLGREKSSLEQLRTIWFSPRAGQYESKLISDHLS